MAHGLQRGRRVMGEINVVPYIDVMLVLLIIFMVTAPLLTPGVQVDLPKSAAKPLDAKQKANPLVLSIRADGNLYVNVGGDPNQALNAAAVVARVSAALRQQPDMPVQLNADRRIDYGVVMDAMVLLQKAGAPKVGLVTKTLVDAGTGIPGENTPTQARQQP